MAHWIIEDHGFGGQFYRCSECRKSWCDIFQDVSMEDNCPNCGVAIDEDETEYRRLVIPHIPIVSTQKECSIVRLHDEMDGKLVQLSGYKIEQLVELFAAGWTLEPPKYTGMEEMTKEFE